MHHTPQRILILGAQGLTGSQLLDRLLAEPCVSRVIAPTRKALPPHARLDNPVGELADLLPQLQGPLDIAFSCLGTQPDQVSSEQALRESDLQQVLRAGERARVLGARHYLVLSAVDADSGAAALYERVKGELEEALQDQGWPQLTLVRPSLPLPREDEVPFAERLTTPLRHWLPGKWRAISPSELSHALWRLALEDDEGVRVVEPEELYELGR